MSASRPCLQRIEGFTAVSCVLIFLQGMYSTGLVPATLTAWEKAFKLTTSEVAPAVTCYVVAKLVSGIPLTYYCSGGHVPRHLGWQFALIGVTAVITAIPWLITTVDAGVEHPNVCYLDGHPESAACSQQLTSNGYQYFVFLAQTINGFAASCLYTLAPSFIESNSPPETSSRYLSYYLASAPLGVAVGFVMQGVAVDAGVWGLTYVVTGVLMVLVAILLFRMPEKMRVERLARSDSQAAAEDVAAVMSRRSSLNAAKLGMREGLRAFAEDASVVLRNSVWWCFALAASVEAFFVVGINNYGPKIMASYFSITPGTAAMLAGGLLVPAAVFGQIVGGVWDSKRSKHLGHTAGLTKWIALVALVAVVSVFAVQCDTLSYSSRDDQGCAGACNCVEKFDPICVNGTELHFNGCYSGCTDYDATTGVYSNCTVCGGAAASTVTEGACDSMKCDKLLGMVVVFFLAVFFTFMNNPPSQMVMMRVVPPRLSANALALNDVVYRLVGSLPGVPVWAAAIDSTCVHRNKNVCGVEGECGFYDNGKIAVLFLLLGGIPKLLSFMFFFLGSSVLYRRMPDLAKRSYNKDSGSEAGSGDAEALQNKL